MQNGLLLSPVKIISSCMTKILFTHSYFLLFDPVSAQSANEILPFIEKERPEYVVIYDDGFNYLTKMCLTNMRDAAFEMIRFTKERGCTVIVSSSDSTDRFEMYL